MVSPTSCSQGAFYYRSALFALLTSPNLNILFCSMHVLSQRLVGASTTVPSPPSAATRITHRPFTSLMKEKWNQQTAAVVEKVHGWDSEVQEWGRKFIYAQKE
ncbi:hypothetical protein HWV62_41438 [Athelia sp. TMB]|nr:hypothetical protein HWV62_41438 [Athelia sp. TMB]